MQMIKKFIAKTKEIEGPDVQSEDQRAANPILKEFKENYEEEIRLNDEFNQFVLNFRSAYEGPNTAQFQIGAKYATPERELRQIS